MIPRPRLLNRSQTGPVPLDPEKKTGRSSSACSYKHLESVSSSSSAPVITFVKPKRSDGSQSQSLDSGLTFPTSSIPEDVPGTINQPSSSNTCIKQVHEFIFLGTADSAVDIRSICQNNIHYFVDVSKKTGSMRASKSCTCLHQVHAFDAIVAQPYYEDMPTKELFAKFQAVNEIIRRARNKAQRVFIYSEDSLTACQAFALAYNMQYYNLTLQRALDNFTRLRMNVELSNYLRNALEKWATLCEEEKKVREASSSRRSDWQETRPATVDCGVKRVAWQ